ncbi:beta-glucosidase BglX [Paenibacillus sp. MMS20-IR301]|uniref:beta-glucosidase BglX n=1 Tax=Paenibacillus sp. MMS20-IR301 TaxID=2895946 RepID=UPI0028E27C0F|nr:beta-glucosidase BglX [Paenibacillus sp. MMS20-IR301]WNS41398.1 beta-glucosidase BglX [Paenibacillus sp. MMS20-IR301]
MEEKQLVNLLETLTVEEKIGQLIQLSGDFFNTDAMAVGPVQKLGIDPHMVQLTGSVLNVLGADQVIRIQQHHLEHSRHKIPLLFMADIVYGYKTVFPIPLALGCSWNPGLVKACNELTAKEACAAGAHVTFAPMVDVVRDARWGRCMESTGEDTYLNSVFAKAMVEGFQGDFTPGSSLASCVKHYAAYGAPEGGREYNTVDMSERRLREEYLPPYKAAVEAGCALVMTAFNTVDEIPATANGWLMDEVLRREWGFDGVLITDYAAIAELVAHGVAEDDKAAARLAMEAGVDIDMKTACYANQLQPLLEEGTISLKKLDEAVLRVLKLKNKLGLFEDPFRGASPAREQELKGSADSLSLSRQAAAESLVLLQNLNSALPLQPGKKIALIGPYADSKELNGLWAVYGDKDQVVTVKSAFQEILEPQLFKSTQGCEMLDSYEGLGSFGYLTQADKRLETDEQRAAELEQAVALAKWADVVIFAMGEHTLQSGEAGSRTDLSLPGIQTAFMEQVLPWAKESVLLLFNGRPLVLTDIKDKVDAILECWFPGTEGGHAIADLLTGAVNPSGRLTMSFPYAAGQVPVYYNSFNTGRPSKTSTHSLRFTSRYLDCPNEPLYPFGYGLSYHTAEYSHLRLSSTVLRPGEVIEAEIEVQNTSGTSGDEVVQLYIRDLVGSVVRPVKELRDFRKLHLQAGEQRKISFSITEEQLKFHTKDMKYAAEEGNFELYIGNQSDNCLMAAFSFER